MEFEGMKRKELQALCKKHGVPANLTTREMARRLALLLQEDEKPVVSDRETDSIVVAKNVKKVKFSPENETFIFVESGSDSDLDYGSERKKPASRKSATKRKQVYGDRITRSRAKSVAVPGEDSESVSLPVKGRKRGRRGQGTLGVSDLGCELTGRQLRRKNLVNEAAGNGDLAVSGEKIMGGGGSKKTGDVKASDGVPSADQTFEDASEEKATKPEETFKNSKRNLTKQRESSVAPSEDIGKIGIGERMTRARTRATRTGSAVDGLKTRKEFQDVLQCEVPLNGLGQIETTTKKNPRKRSKKEELEEVSKIEPSSDATEQFLPEGPKRTRRNVRLFSPDVVSTVDKTSEAMNQERGANKGKPPRQSTCIASKMSEIAESIVGNRGKPTSMCKEGQKKQRQEPNLNQQNSANLQEPSNNKHLRRSTRYTSKGNSVELMELTPRGRAAKKNKLKKNTLHSEESPAINVGLAVPEVSNRKFDPDLLCSKGGTQRSGEDRKEFRRKSAVMSPLQSVPLSAANRVATDMKTTLEGKVLASSECRGISMVEPTKESVVDLLVKEKESIADEEINDNSLYDNIEGDIDEPLCNSVDTCGNSSDYNLLGAMEYSKEHIDVDVTFPDNCLSPTNQVDSQGDCSNVMDVKERPETKAPFLSNSMHLVSNEAYDKLSEDVKAIVQENQCLVALDLGEKSYSGQDNLTEVGESRESERCSENLSEKPENTCPIVRHDTTKEKVENTHFPRSTPSNSAPVSSEPATESQEGTEVPDETTFSRETRFSVERVQARHYEKTEEIITTKEQESEEALNNGLPSVVAIANDIPCNIGDASVRGGVDDVTDSGYDNKLTHAHEDIMVPQVETVATGTRGVDREKIDSANKWEKEHAPEVKLSFDSLCKSPEAYSTTALQLNVSSPHGDECGSQNLSEDMIAADKENRCAGEDKSTADRNNEVSIDAELNQECSVSIPEFSEELFDDHKGAEEGAASVNDDYLTSNQPLCGDGTENVAEQAEEVLDFQALDGKPIKSEGVQRAGALADSCFHSEIRHNMNVDCAVSSPDNGVSELHVHTAVTTILETNMSLGRSEEDNVKYVHEILAAAAASTESEKGGENKEVEENVIMSGEFDQVFERQLGEHEHHTEPAFSKDLFSGDNENSNEQDDASAIIQEYIGCETRMDELIKMDSYGPLNKGRMTNVSVDDTETQSVAEPAVDKIFNDSGEEDAEAPEIASKGTKIEKDKGTMAAERALPKTNDAAPTDSNDVVPVNHEISETPIVILGTMLRSELSDDVRFNNLENNMEASEELDGSAYVASDNSMVRAGKTTNGEGKVARVVGDLNSQVNNFPAETRVNLDAVPDMKDDILDKLAEEEIHDWYADGPHTALVNTHGKKTVSTYEAGAEPLEGRIGSAHAEDATELLGLMLNSPPKFKVNCRSDEKSITAIKLMVDTPIVSPSTGIVPGENDSYKQGNNELGTYGRCSQHHRCGSKEACPADNIDFLELNSLFSSNGSKINSKQTRKDLDLQDSEDLEVHFGASKDVADLEEPFAIMKHEMGVQCPVASLVKTVSNACTQATPTDILSGRKIEKRADCDAELALFTEFELNLFSEDSEREEVDTIYARNLEENLMSETTDDVKQGGDAVVISGASAEQNFHLENEPAVDAEIMKHNQLGVCDEPNKENEGLKREGVTSDDSFDFEDSSGASGKCTSYDENDAKYKSTGFEDVTSFVMTSTGEVTMETTNLNKDVLEVNAAMINASSDEPITESGGLTGRGDLFVDTEDVAIEIENSVCSFEMKGSNFAASGEPMAEFGADDPKHLESSHSEEISVEGMPDLVMNDSNEYLFKTMEPSKGVSVTNVEILEAASDEPIFGNKQTNEKCDEPIINQESGDCESNRDGFVLLEKCLENSNMDGCSSASSKHTTECDVKDSKKGHDAPVNLDVEVAASEDAEARQVKLELGHENACETNLFEGINEFAKRKNDINILIPATPKNLHKVHDMKENLLSAKTEQFGSVAASRKSAKRQPLVDLQKN